VPLTGTRVAKPYPGGVLGPADDHTEAVYLFKVALLAFALPFEEL
jgi:hypothetical protein